MPSPSRAFTLLLLIALSTVPLRAQDTPRVLALEARDAFPLTASVWTPAGEGTVPGVVLLHMYCGTRKDWTTLAPRLVAEGYAVLALDLRGHGESKAGGKVDMEKLEIKEGMALAARMVLDAQAAVAALKREKRVDPKRLWIVGGSLGANVAVAYVAEDRTVRGAVLLSPGLDYLGVESEAAVAACAGRPVLALAAKGDVGSQEAVEAYLKKHGKVPWLDAEVLSATPTLGANGPILPHGTDLLPVAGVVDRVVAHLKK